VIEGDAREVLSTFEPDTVDCTVTSPAYFRHRTYAGGAALGREDTIGEYVDQLVAVFAEVLRVLKPTGTCFVNLGETYAKKHALLVPERVAVALSESGWIVRNTITWVRTNVRPESAKDRLTNATEVVIFCTKEPSGYHFDPEPLREPAAWDHWGRQTSGKARRLASGGSWQSENPDRRAELAETKSRHPRDVWEFRTENRPNNGLAPFPEELSRRCLKLGCPEGGVVLDPFAGTGTTLVVARSLGMQSIGIDCDPAAIAEMRRRLGQLTVEGGESAA
jgi:site-specific DNA-methyltransferase (adenine-specific)